MIYDPSIPLFSDVSFCCCKAENNKTFAVAQYRTMQLGLLLFLVLVQIDKVFCIKTTVLEGLEAQFKWQHADYFSHNVGYQV